MRFLWIFIIYIYIHTTHEAVVAQWNSATVNATVLDLIPFLVEEERGSTTQQAMSLKSDGVSWYSSVLCLPFTNVVGSILTPSWLHLNNIFFPWVFKPEYFFTFTLPPAKDFFTGPCMGNRVSLTIGSLCLPFLYCTLCTIKL